MPSNQFVLAYYSDHALTIASIQARIAAAREYTESLHRKPCITEQSSTGENSGVITWQPCEDSIGWPQFKSQGSDAVAWIGIPEHDAMSSTPTDALEVARQAVRPDFDADTLGAPYACIYKSGEQLVIVNDSLGLARLFQFDFSGLTVWASRPGLAHIFAGVHIAKHDATWSGMATLGWNVGGHTHIGSGQQLAGGTRVTANTRSGVTVDDRYADWLHTAPMKGSSWEAASAGMVRKMSLGGYFPRSPIADLSGGKDSRLLAAAALTSGVTDTVRTVRTDHGEVETAERLVEAYAGKVDHLVTEVSRPQAETVVRDFASHIETTMRGTEGATVPFTALRGPSFAGYSPLVVARFNGHGGEALNGGEYYKGAWAEKLAGKGLSGALDRMTTMVSVARATTESGRERTIEIIRARLNRGASMGIDTAHGLLNYHYSAERMPFWASSSPNRSVITPYYSSGLLHQIARTFTGETEFSKFYWDILSSLVPAWTEIPFYSPVGITRRVSKFFWEGYEWRDLKEFILDNVDASENFDPVGIRALVEEVESGLGSKSLEASLSRFLWEISVYSVVDEINRRVDSVRAMI